MLRNVMDWREDTRWHRRMFAQSRFRWTPQDALRVASRFSGGRLEFTTVKHLVLLDQAATDLFDYTDTVRLSLAGPVRAARDAFGPSWLTVLPDVGLTEIEARLILAAGSVHLDEPVSGDVSRVLRDLPLPNPLTQIWEIRQLQGMYLAAHGVLEDTFADLITELSERVPLSLLAARTSSLTARRLEQRLETQAAARGGPLDPRRRTEQRFPALVMSPAS